MKSRDAENAKLKRLLGEPMLDVSTPKELVGENFRRLEGVPVPVASTQTTGRCAGACGN